MLFRSDLRTGTEIVDLCTKEITSPTRLRRTGDRPETEDLFLEIGSPMDEPPHLRPGKSIDS